MINGAVASLNNKGEKEVSDGSRVEWPEYTQADRQRQTGRAEEC